jgi:hypothetical protein
MEKSIHWKYQIYYGMRSASEAGAIDHPQKEMNKFIGKMKEKSIDIEVLESESVPIGDCWIFLIKCSTPWLVEKLPSYMIAQGLRNDKEGLYS